MTNTTVKIRFNRDLYGITFSKPGQLVDTICNFDKGDELLCTVVPGTFESEADIITADGTAPAICNECFEIVDCTFTVHSSWGDFTALASDGTIVKKDLYPMTKEERAEDEACEYRFQDMLRFDVDEWRKAYPGELLADMHIDILDLGAYWTGDRHTGPEMDWREE